MWLYGQQWTRRELEARVGRIEQLGGVRRLRHTEGMEEGNEWIQVRTGSGLTYYISPHRGLDISLAEYAGVPLSWQSPNGDPHPAYYDAQGKSWVHTAAGGLLMTCGLMNVGLPNDDLDKHYGLHGRIHHLPSRHVSAEAHWNDEEYEMCVRGVIDETSIFGDQLRLTREIRSRLGENVIRIHDTVENMGFHPAGHMILYHINLGFPLMHEATTSTFPPASIVPVVSSTSQEGIEQWQVPTKGYHERVYEHQLTSPYHFSDWASVFTTNPTFPLPGTEYGSPLALEVRFKPHQLPRLFQWKMPGEGMHALGIEPSNCGVKGRAHEREQGTLQYLEPGESRQYELEIHIHLSTHEHLS